MSGVCTEIARTTESLDLILSSQFYLQTEHSCLSYLSLSIPFPTRLRETRFQPPQWEALETNLQDHWVDIFLSCFNTGTVTQVSS